MLTEFVDLFQQYIGTLTQEDAGSLVFKSVNDLIDYWGKHHKVECKIVVTMSYIVDPKRFSVLADEKTCAIIGGSACGALTFEEAMEMVRKRLEQYNFKPRNDIQTALF